MQSPSPPKPAQFAHTTGAADFFKPGTEARRFFPWPYGELSPEQQAAHLQQLEAMRNDELRRIPSVFGDLDEVKP